MFVVSWMEGLMEGNEFFELIFLTFPSTNPSTSPGSKTQPMKVRVNWLNQETGVKWTWLRYRELGIPFETVIHLEKYVSLRAQHHCFHPKAVSCYLFCMFFVLRWRPILFWGLQLPQVQKKPVAEVADNFLEIFFWVNKEKYFPYRDVSCYGIVTSIDISWKCF